MATQTPFESFTIPLQDQFLDDGINISRPWEYFFRTIFRRLSPLGVERSFPIVNNQASAADVTGLSFDSKEISAAFVEYLIQRVTTSTGAVEKIETGIFKCSYKPTSATWNLNSVSSGSPDNAGITFSITSGGKVQYTSTNITGTVSISKLYWRVRTLGGKNSLYSSFSSGGRS